MKLEKVLDKLNAFEKNSFLKIIDNLIERSPKNKDKINEIMSEFEEREKLKNMDTLNIVRVFNLLEDEYSQYLYEEIAKPNSQLDLVTDIIIRDGNCIMKYDWLASLYEKIIKEFERKRNVFCKDFFGKDKEPEDTRCRDYMIYKACLDTAYNNDVANNQDKKITSDEHSILVTLSKMLALSQEEVKLIKYMTMPLIKQPIEEVINNLKIAGIAFYSKKMNTVYIADEIVRLLRKVRGKEIADKFYRRTLKNLSPAQIKRVCKNHNLQWKDCTLEEMIKMIIDNGIPFKSLYSEDIYPNNTSLTDKKMFIKELCDKKLKIEPPIKGVTISDKLDNIIKHFEAIENDDKVSISFDGYEKLLKELNGQITGLNQAIREEFELQDNYVLSSNYLIDYNIKPRDVIDVIPDNELQEFCKNKGIKTRGDIIQNILDAYTDSENIYLENYELIGYRDINTLKSNGIDVLSTDLGLLFENLTKSIFTHLGFNVDEDLRKELSTNKDKIDIVLNLGNQDIIVVECKTVKEKGYNKFSSVSRQIKSYTNLCHKNKHNVVKVLLVAPDFSDDFINDCRLDYELNLSLIKASTLYNIMECFKNSKLKEFPLNLFRKDVLISETNVIKAIGK